MQENIHSHPVVVPEITIFRGHLLDVHVNKGQYRAGFIWFEEMEKP